MKISLPVFFKGWITKVSILAALLVWAGPAVSGPKPQSVERPFKSEATVTWTIDMTNGSGVGHHRGVATHTGLFTAEGTAIWDLENFVIVSGTGVSVAANGDELFWKMTADEPAVVQFIGGTGRFKNAIGFAPSTSIAVLESNVDPDTMTLTMTLTYTLEGTITY